MRKLNFIQGLAVYVLTFCFVVIIILLLHKIPAENRDLGNQIFVFVTGTMIVSVIGFFYGSSDKSRPVAPLDKPIEPIIAPPIELGPNGGKPDKPGPITGV